MDKPIIINSADQHPPLNILQEIENSKHYYSHLICQIVVGDFSKQEAQDLDYFYRELIKNATPNGALIPICTLLLSLLDGYKPITAKLSPEQQIDRMVSFLATPNISEVTIRRILNEEGIDDTRQIERLVNILTTITEPEHLTRQMLSETANKVRSTEVRISAWDVIRFSIARTFMDPIWSMGEWNVSKK